MNMKFVTKIDPRLAIAFLFAVALVGTLATVTYGFMLSSRVDRILAQVDKTLDEVTSGTTTRVADKATSATRSRDAATSGSTRASVAATSGTRRVTGPTSGTRTARHGMPTSGTQAALQTSGTRMVRNGMPTSGTQAALQTSGSRTVRNGMPTSGTQAALQTSGTRTARNGLPTSGSRSAAMANGRDRSRAGMPGRNARGGPGGQTASASLPTTVTQLIDTKGLFGRKPQPQQSVALQGILGESALINGQWIKVGESQGAVKLLELYPNKAVVEFQGSRRELTIWSDLPQG